MKQSDQYRPSQSLRDHGILQRVFMLVSLVLGGLTWAIDPGYIAGTGSHSGRDIAYHGPYRKRGPMLEMSMDDSRLASYRLTYGRDRIRVLR